MRRLTQEQVQDIDFKHRRTAADSPAAHIYSEVNALGVGEGLLVKRGEWPLRYTPANTTFPNRLRTGGRKYTVRTLADDTGFVVTRTA